MGEQRTIKEILFTADGIKDSPLNSESLELIAVLEDALKGLKVLRAMLENTGLRLGRATADTLIEQIEMTLGRRNG